MALRPLCVGMLCLQCIDAVGWAQEGHPACKNLWWGAGMVICLERDADLHMAQVDANATHCLLLQ